MRFDIQIRQKICTCHDSWAVVACANLLPDWIIRIKMRAKGIFTRFQLWAHKYYMQWVTMTWSVPSQCGNRCNVTQPLVSLERMRNTPKLLKFWWYKITSSCCGIVPTFILHLYCTMGFTLKIGTAPRSETGVLSWCSASTSLQLLVLVAWPQFLSPRHQ